jgi:DmsE family decaheme c-type cytochrome
MDTSRNSPGNPEGGLNSTATRRTALVRRSLLAVAALALLGAVTARTSVPLTVQATTQQPAGQPPAGQPPAAAAGYAGEATCLTCHGDQSYAGTAHGRTFHERTPAATQGCESCHGPGKAHAEAGGDKSLIKSFKTMEPSEASQMCATCHTRASHALWEGSQHDQRNLSCGSCHKIHSPVGTPSLAAETETALCGRCHKPVANRQHRFSHMPVREGAMTCSSCHNVHGSTNVRLLRAGTTIDESCTSCHAEKRGPFLWEHAPVSESCITCHEPHGSNNDRMLVSKQPFLCQRCHVTSRHPPTVYEGYLLNNSQNANKIYARGCTICHQQVHGSNAPSGKALLR